MIQGSEENDCRNYFMINLHESMGLGRDRTRDPPICSQSRICCQTRYRLRYAARSLWNVITLTSCLSFLFEIRTSIWTHRAQTLFIFSCVVKISCTLPSDSPVISAISLSELRLSSEMVSWMLLAPLEERGLQGRKSSLISSQTVVLEHFFTLLLLLKNVHVSYHYYHRT